MTKSTTALSALSLLAALFALEPSAEAATLTVCSSGCNYTSPQAAIDAAGWGDTVQLGAEAFVGQLSVGAGEYVILDGQGAATLDANGGAALTVAANGSAVLQDLDVTGGGGVAGIINYGTLTLESTVVTGCDAQFGALLNHAVLAVVADSVFSDNSSTAYFAGAINNLGTADISNATFLNNEGHNGGAVANLAGDMWIEATSFTANSAYLGGAVHNSNATLHLEDSSFSTNHADAIGGGWSNHNLGGTVTTSNVGYAANTTGSGSFLDCYDVNGTC